jgi:hypothetical protein
MFLNRLQGSNEEYFKKYKSCINRRPKIRDISHKRNMLFEFVLLETEREQL